MDDKVFKEYHDSMWELQKNLAELNAATQACDIRAPWIHDSTTGRSTADNSQSLSVAPGQPTRLTDILYPH